MTAPSPFYRQHRAFEAPQMDAQAFRPAWRVKTPLDRLFRAKAITWREYHAGCRFRDANERAFGGLLRSASFLLRTGALEGSGGAALLDSFDDIGNLSAISVALGKTAYLLLDAVIVQEITWVDLGAQFRVDPRTARSWTTTAIKALAAFTS